MVNLSNRTHFRLDEMAQAHVGLNHLNPVVEPYKYPFMGLRFPNAFWLLSSKSREKEFKYPHFQSLLFRVSWTWFESLGERLWVYETSRAFRHVLHRMNFNLGTSKWHVWVLISRFVLLHGFWSHFFFTMLDLKIPTDRYMHSRVVIFAFVGFLIVTWLSDLDLVFRDVFFLKKWVTLRVFFLYFFPLKINKNKWRI